MLSNRIKEAAKKISIVTAIEVLLKVIGFLSGILIIRLLPKDEYAFYTIVNTMMGSIALMSGSGVASGVMKIGGQVYRDKVKLGRVIQTALKLRRKLGLFCYLLVCPIVFYMLHKNGASYLMGGLLCLSMLPAFYSQLSAGLYHLSIKLNQDLVPLQTINLQQNLLRLGISVATLFVFPFAALAILGAGVAQYIANVRLRRLSEKYASISGEESVQVKNELIGIVKRAMPTAIYFGLSGQISVWLISFFGTVESVAEIGALSRLSMVFSVVNSLFVLIVAPRFARLGNDKKSLAKRFLQIELVLVVLAFLVPTTVSLIPNQILWLLGEDYQGLNSELVLLGGTIGLSVLINGLAAMNSSRAFILNPLIHIPFNIIVLVATALVIDPTSTYNVLLIDFFRAAMAPLLLNFVFFKYLRKA
ncbi:MAG: O-antigen/teichoic acid export membrane protein [Bdellovibrionota bacterium]